MKYKVCGFVLEYFQLKIGCKLIGVFPSFNQYFPSAIHYFCLMLFLALFSFTGFLKTFTIYSCFVFLVLIISLYDEHISVSLLFAGCNYLLLLAMYNVIEHSLFCRFVSIY